MGHSPRIMDHIVEWSDSPDPAAVARTSSVILNSAALIADWAEFSMSEILHPHPEASPYIGTAWHTLVDRRGNQVGYLQSEDNTPTAENPHDVRIHLHTLDSFDQSEWVATIYMTPSRSEDVASILVAASAFVADHIQNVAAAPTSESRR